jgi:serine/threonine protein kinase
LEHEPKKKLPEKGEVRLIITYDSGKPVTVPVSQAAPAQQPALPASATAGTGAVTTEKLEDKYDLGKEIGRGGFSVVKKGKNKTTGEDVAVKCINKKTLKKEELQLLSREINIMKKLQHKNIVQLFDIYETVNDLFLVLEFIPGGELFDQVSFVPSLHFIPLIPLVLFFVCLIWSLIILLLLFCLLL